MNNLKTYSDAKLVTIASAPEVSGVLRELCYRELQARFRDRHGLREAPVSTSTVAVAPLISVAGYA